MERQKIIDDDGFLHCSVCGEAIQLAVPFPDIEGKNKTITVGRNCKCKRAELEVYEKRMQFEEEQSRVDELRQLSLMDTKLRSVRFSNYHITQENENAFKIARNYVTKFADMYSRSQGILFWGDVGTGKSYIAAAIANELLDRMTSVVMTSFIKLLQEMEGFDTDDSDYVERLNRARLLVIDDFGAERGTDFALEKVYSIIDSRYRSGKPIILTTNLAFGQMKACADIRYNRIYDRIFEMCYPVKMEGMSWRKKEAVARYEDMKKILEG